MAASSSHRQHPLSSPCGPRSAGCPGRLELEMMPRTCSIPRRQAIFDTLSGRALQAAPTSETPLLGVSQQQPHVLQLIVQLEFARM
eukprot:749986-Hanusia_phi.AAC.1